MKNATVATKRILEALRASTCQEAYTSQELISSLGLDPTWVNHNMIAQAIRIHPVEEHGWVKIGRNLYQRQEAAPKAPPSFGAGWIAVIEKNVDLINYLTERMIHQGQEISSLKQRIEALEHHRG